MTGLFITWLYIDAPKTYFGYIQELIFALFEYFSISLLTKTLIAPYRHDSVAISQLPLSQWGQAIVTNFASRAIGFVVRSFVIGVGLLTIVIVGIGSVIFTIAWYLLPILLVASIVYGLTIFFGSSA